MTHAVTLSERRPARCVCGLLCVALALLLSAVVMPSAATASVSTGAAILSSVPPSRAAELPIGALIDLGTVDWTRTSSYDGWNWAKPDLLSYYTDTAGNLAIVAHDATAGTLSVETYDPSTLERIGVTRTISLAGWPDWGGFYTGPDGCSYVLVGRENPNEDDTLDVVAVRRYDRDWTLVGTAYVQGGAPMGIFSPFAEPMAASAPHMALVGDRLVVHMARLIYAHEGVHHQVNLTFEVDVDTMTATTFDRFDGWPYSSHSMQQLVAMNGSDLVTIDHGDAYPRAIQMGVIAGYPTQRHVATYDLFPFNGATGDNFTGATVTGLVSGPSGIVVVGNSIRHPDAPDGPLGSADEHRNIYAIWADPASGEHTVRWLTDFAPQGADDALEPRIVRVGPDRCAVLFSVRNDGGYRMEYRLIDSAGTVLASTSFPGAFFCAISEPILIGGKVCWVGIEPDSWSPPVPAYLFGIDLSDPTRPSLIDRTPPTTTASGASATAWYRTARTITFTATDNEGGSGVAKTEFKLDAASWTPGTSVTVPAPADHSGDGMHTVAYRATDLAGNIENDQTLAVKIDTMPPATVASGVPVGWSATPVTVTLSSSDAGSGVAAVEYRIDGGAWIAGEGRDGAACVIPAPADHSGDGMHTVAYRATDLAGNIENDQTLAVKIDTMPPATVASGVPVGWSATPVTVTLSSSDAGSGVAITEYRSPAESGWSTYVGPFVVAVRGASTYECRSRDVAGNVEAIKTFTVRLGVTPRLAALRPSAGKRGALVTLTGTGFGRTRSTSFVRFGAARCSKYLSWSDTRIQCRVPSTAKIGVVQVTVTSAVGASGARRFSVKR